MLRRLLLGLLPLAALAQPPYLNLSFETNSRGFPWGWGSSSPGYEAAADAGTAHAGNQSLRIRWVNAPATTFADVYQRLPPELFRGKRLRFTCYIKSQGITRGTAKTWLRADGAAGVLSIDNSEGPAGDSGWTAYAIDRFISPDATNIYFGMLLTGDGTGWFDDVQLEVDGVPFQPGPAPLLDLGDTQRDWLKQALNQFFTEMPGGDLNDLWPVKGMVADAHVVGLGEGTHGSAEFFRMKHRLLQYLVTEMGFSVFAIEANMPEAYAVNDYVLYGRGDPKQLLRGMYFWTWNTQEVLDMIQWMRQYNASGQGTVQFTGFDMQTGTVAMETARSFVQKADPDYLATLNAAYAQAAPLLKAYSTDTRAVTAAAEQAVAVREHLEANRDLYLGSYSPAEIDWAIQNARVLEQSVWYLIRGTSFRDLCMAANMDWILAQNPGEKAVVWAHDYHVSRQGGARGSYLASTHGGDYLPVGQVFHAGRYNAVTSTTNGVLRANDAVPSFPGSVEYALHSTGEPRLILDLRKASPDDPASSWLLGEIEWRSIGAVVNDGFGVTPDLRQLFDILIFFDQVTPSVLLP